MIWKNELKLDELNNMAPNIATLIGIEFTEWDDNSLSARMPVDQRTHQPAGILHGGASVVLAETIGSMASAYLIDRNKYMAVGLEINANHLRPATKGFVTGKCTAVHIGGKTHIWDIRITDDRNKMVCISRLTIAVIPKPAISTI